MTASHCIASDYSKRIWSTDGRSRLESLRLDPKTGKKSSPVFFFFLVMRARQIT